MNKEFYETKKEIQKLVTKEKFLKRKLKETEIQKLKLIVILCDGNLEILEKALN